MTSARAPGEALRLLGVVFQPRTLDLDLSVTQNLLYHAALHGIARREARARSGEVLARIGLADRAGSKVRDLSGGQMRRLEIARALLHRPRLLLLDEATVGLDVKARADILNHVRQLVTEQGISVLWATHLFDEIGSSDDLVVLHQGRVLAQGQVARVIADAGAQRHQHRLHAADRRRGTDREPDAMSSATVRPIRSGFSFARISHLPERHRLARGACASCISASASSRRWCGRWCGCSSSPPASVRCSASPSSRHTRPTSSTRSTSRPA